MEFFVTDYCTVDRVENGFAVGTFRVPVDIIDEVMEVSYHTLNSARTLKNKIRSRAAEAKQPLSRFGVKNK